jgi:hypothetical protein
MTDDARLDGAFVPGRHPGVRAVPTDDGGVLVDESGGRVLPMNPSAMLVWECLDGASAVHEICADIAEGVGVPYERVLADVLVVVEGLLDQGLLASPGAEASDDAAEAARTRAIERLDASFPPDARVDLSVEVMGQPVHLRANDPEMLALLEEAFTDAEGVHAIATANGGSTSNGEPRAGAELSVLFGERVGGIEPLHFLYRHDRLVFRSPSPGRVLRACLREIDALLPVPDGLVRLDARTVLGPAGAVLVGGPFLEMLDLSERRLARAGWQVLDGPTLVDRERLVVLPRARLFTPSADGAAAIDSRFPPGRHERPVDGAERPVRAVVFVGSPPEEGKLGSQAQRLAALAPFVGELRRAGSADDLGALGRLADGRKCVWLLGLDDQELLECLSELAPRRTR